MNRTPTRIRWKAGIFPTLILSFGLPCLTAGHCLGQPSVGGWGDNSFDQIRTPPQLTNATAIAVGGYHSLALQSNGVVVAWGDDSATQIDVPADLNGVKAIAAGSVHSLALKTNGTVMAWGSGAAASAPPGLTNVLAIAAGDLHSLVLLSNQTVFGWGESSSGQTSPSAGLTNVVAIAGGGTHSLALRNNGTVAAWGSGPATNVPPGLSGVTAISGGGSHSLALLSNGTVVAWGEGVATNVPSNLSNVIAVAAGPFHSLALRSDGSVVGWGLLVSTNGLLDATPPLNFFNLTAIAAAPANATPSHSLALGCYNDSFACRLPLSGTSTNFVASNVGASEEPLEPRHSLAVPPSEHSVWYTWRAPSAGGALIRAASDVLQIPVLAVYTGTNLTNLVKVADNTSAFYKARLVFTAVSNQTYQIAVDGVSFGFSPEGYLNMSLDLFPPPPNDNFSNATEIIGNYYASPEPAQLFGASREPGELSHGTTNFSQTLWWTWTAPTNNGTSNSLVSLTTDAVSFPPGLGVYLGNSVSNLTSVLLSQQTNVVTTNGVFTNGMSSFASFTAVAGTTYRIALAGQQSDPLGNIISPRYGEYRFRLVNRGLALRILNLVTSNTAPDAPVSFDADAQIINLGPAASNPLQVSVSALSGVSLLGPDNGFFVNDRISIGTWPASPIVLTQGQTATVHISGTNPPPDYPSNTNGVGYGAYAELQEQPLANTWFTVDQSLILFGNWPSLDGNTGPGGGVIRLDPGSTSASAFNPVTNMAVLGPAILPEGSSATYTGWVAFALGDVATFTNTAWSASPSSFPISTNGLFTAASVTADTVVSLGAPFSYAGLIPTAMGTVLVSNLPPPSLLAPKVLANGSFSLTLSGVPGRTHVIDATTNISPAVWVPLITNATATNGLTNLVDSFRTNLNRRFYRAREM